MQLDPGIAIYFFITIWASSSMQFAGAHPLFWFDETRSSDGSVSSVHVGRQAKTATGHGHLEGYMDLVG